MFWNIFLNSLILIIGVLVLGWLIDKVVRGLSDSDSDRS